ncbi:MAG: hypothetical protein KDC42_05240 [Ignavibacteriae bacterium]|nr:hypothetical protein [Ignavibacteriota bacterium]
MTTFILFPKNNSQGNYADGEPLLIPISSIIQFSMDIEVQGHQLVLYLKPGQQEYNTFVYKYSSREKANKVFNDFCRQLDSNGTIIFNAVIVLFSEEMAIERSNKDVSIYK